MSLLEYFDGTNWISGAGSGTVTSLNIVGSNGLSVTGSPITTSGTINLTLGSELQALSAFSGNGFMVKTGNNTYTPRTIVEGLGVTVDNGDGINGNPIFGLKINSDITDSLSTMKLRFNNQNLTGLTSFTCKKNGSNRGEFGHDNGDDELFMWAKNGSSIVFKTESIIRAEFGLDGTFDLFNNDIVNAGNITGQDLTASGFVKTNNIGTISGNTITSSSSIDLVDATLHTTGKVKANKLEAQTSATIDVLTPVDLGNNNLTTTGEINAKTGTLKANNIGTHDSTFIDVQDSINMTTNQIVNMADATSPQGAVTKSQLDQATLEPPELPTLLDNSVASGRKLLAYRLNINSSIGAAVKTNKNLSGIISNSNAELLTLNILRPLSNGVRASYGYGSNAIKASLNASTLTFEVTNATISAGSVLVATILG